jgi:hypothetical protein
MSRKRPPLPMQPTREGEALRQGISSQEDFDRTRHDVDNTPAQSVSGASSVVLTAFTDVKIYHGLGRIPTGWRIIDITGGGASQGHGVTHHIDADLAGPATATHWMYVSSVDLILAEAYIIANGALVANDVNYATLSFGHYDASGPTTVLIGSMTTETIISGGTGDWAAGDAFKLSDYDTIDTDNAQMTAGFVLVYDVDKTAGAGITLPDHEVVVEYRHIHGGPIVRAAWDKDTLTLSNEDNAALTVKVEVF